jgi:hypothetical protein
VRERHVELDRPRDDHAEAVREVPQVREHAHIHAHVRGDRSLDGDCFGAIGTAPHERLENVAALCEA